MNADLAAELTATLDDLGQPPTDDEVASSGSRMGSRTTIGSLPLAQIHPRPDQPRQHMDEMALTELTASVRQHGVLQPIRVRVRPSQGGWEIIAGHRRWTAAGLAGLTEIPAVVASADDDQAFVEALTENVQREDLNLLDRAAALVRLRTALGLDSWKATGAAIGLHRVTVVRLLGITQLPPEMQEDVRSGSLTEKHARALLSLRPWPAQQDTLWQLIHAKSLSGLDAITAAKAMRPGPVSVSAPAAQDAAKEAPITQVGAFRFREAGETVVPTLGGAQIEIGKLAVVQLGDLGSRTTTAGLWLSALRSDLVAFRSACTASGDQNGWRLVLDMIRELGATVAVRKP